MKHVDLEKPTLFLDQFCLGCTQREREPNEKLVEEYTKMFESLTLAGGVEKLLGSGDVNANISAWSCGSYELSNRNIEQLQTVSTLCVDDDRLKKEDLEPVGDLSNVGSRTTQHVFLWRAAADLQSLV